MRGKEPEIPPDTCPYINFVQEVLEQIKEASDSDLISHQMQLIYDNLEYIREANAQLREVGKFWKKRATKNNSK